jgi:signal transduction histidine kinase
MDSASLSEAQTSIGDYRTLFNQSMVPMALVSMLEKPRFVAASRGFLDVLGLSRGAVVDHPLGDVLARDAGAELAAAVRRCLSTSQSVQVDVAPRARAGRRSIHLWVHNARASGFAGHAVLEAVRQGPAGRPAEDEPASLGQKHGHGDSARFIHDLKCQTIRFAQGAFARRLGLSGGSLGFWDFAARLHPDDLARQSVFRLPRRTAADEEFVTEALRLRDDQGEWRLISFRARVIRRDRGDGPRLMLGRATDITGCAAEAAEAAGFSVIRSEENERGRIGRELHDSTSQYLVAADLGLARILQIGGLSAEARARVQDVQSSLTAAQTEIGAFAYFLHPPELRELGLERTLEKFCSGFARRSGLEITFSARNVPKDVSSDTEHALFRVCQEALMNVHRHAFARRVSVRLRAKDEHLSLEVRDDGIGLEGVDRFEHGGTGLAGMRARMIAIGGDLSLDPLDPGLAVLASVLKRRPRPWLADETTQPGADRTIERARRPQGLVSTRPPGLAP